MLPRWINGRRGRDTAHVLARLAAAVLLADDHARHLVTAHRASHGAPAAVLVRPDGYVAWAGADPTGLPGALDGWFGTVHLPEGSVLHQGWKRRSRCSGP
ncbi:hypothetical protein [Pseudonocardia hierapolitana]|uniref:aromatic-ring hydroxylase C-terminal domain-containing protein n=1 Tax=Pseudonocardia hierapolitana TaxID=1128676 RepID=UPI0011BDC003